MKDKDLLRNTADFLKDELFITWRLTGDEELEKYWNDYLARHPEAASPFSEAAGWFNKEHIRLKTETLSEADKSGLLKRIKQPARRGKIVFWYRYTIAACLAAAIGLGVYYGMEGDAADPYGFDSDLVIGEALSDEAVKFSSSAVREEFDSDVKIEINKEGEAVITDSKEGKPTVVKIDKNALNEIIVPYGRRSSIVLADGTEVWLNSGSTFKFPTEFTHGTREVHLTGEAYLDVAQDKKKPFILHTLSLKVHVHGTQFNVSAYRDSEKQSVILVEGSLGVTSQNHTGQQSLRPDDMLTYSGGNVEKETVDVTKYTSWKDGYVVYDDTPMADVLRQVERYYNIRFTYGEASRVKEKTCTGKLYLADNIDNVMTAISLLSSSELSKEDNTYYIK